MYRIMNYKNIDFNLLEKVNNFSLFIHLDENKYSLYTNSIELNEVFELEKENLPQLPSYSKILKRKKHIISNLKEKLKKFTNKESLKVHREDVLSNIKVDEIDFYKPLNMKKFSLIDLIDELDNIWMEIKINKIKYDIENELEMLADMYNILDLLVNNKIEYLLKNHIPNDIIKQVFTTKIENIFFTKAYENIKKLMELFNKEKPYFTKIKIYGEKEEVNETIKKIEKYFIDEAVEFAEESSIKSRFELFFTYDEVKNFCYLPLGTKTLKKDLDIGDKYALFLDEEKQCFINKENKSGEEIDFDLKYIHNLQIKYDSSKKEEFKDLLQRILLYNVKKRLEEGNDIKVYNINFDFEEYIPKINSLKTFDLVSFINNERELEIFWKNLQEEIKRKTNKISTNIFEYNQNQKMQNLKEPITIISLNTDSVKFPQKIFDLLDKNDLGIYFIFYSKRKKYFNNLTFLEISDNIKLFSKKFNLIKNIPETNDKILDEIIKQKESNQKDYFIIPIGVDDYGNEVNFTFGEMSDSYHAIIIGRTGSGKTSLIRNILIKAAEKYSAEEIQFILMDYKSSGVEFNLFRNHPNVCCITVNPDQLEIALCIFQYIKKIMDERSEKFTKHHVQNITQYDSLNKEKLPKIIIIIDEFHRLLVGDIFITQKLNHYLSHFAREGRATGIHLILSTQSLMNVTLNDDIVSSVKTKISLSIGDMRDVGNIFHDIESKEQALKLRKYQCIYNNINGFYDTNIVVNIYPPVNNEKMEEVFFKLRNLRKEHEVINSKIIKNVEDIYSTLNFICKNEDDEMIFDIDKNTLKLINENEELENSIDFE